MALPDRGQTDKQAELIQLFMKVFLGLDCGVEAIETLCAARIGDLHGLIR